ncbi:septum formation initiator family protein [Gottfriedia sp. NPDC056225]|uniref:FtsB family cell division protein n=1 Tax=Gottfriedia sp. NPDC056225 TaxID=3345751 RepID=UPI001559765A|nr:septum formation initiator family protein [Arthrobacter citreus]
MKAEARKLYNPQREEMNKPSRNQFPQTHKRKTIRIHRITLMILYLSLIIGSVMYMFSQNKIVSAKQRELSKLQVEQKKLTKTEKDLNRQVRLLNDPDYIGNYARGEYMFSKKGETIIIVPKPKEDNN